MMAEVKKKCNSIYYSLNLGVQIYIIIMTQIVYGDTRSLRQIYLLLSVEFESINLGANWMECCFGQLIGEWIECLYLLRLVCLNVDFRLI